MCTSGGEEVSVTAVCLLLFSFVFQSKVWEHLPLCFGERTRMWLVSNSYKSCLSSCFFVLKLEMH